MSFPEFTMLAALKDLFADEIKAVGGQITSTFETEAVFMVRSTLPEIRLVAPGDRVQGGVALLAHQDTVWVHPFVFRQICRNGAIMTWALQSSTIEHSGCESQYETCSNVRQAIRDCCEPAVFANSAEQMRRSIQQPADMVISLMPHLAMLSPTFAHQLFDNIMRRLAKSGDSSRFGLMNAITSVARDTADQNLRWRLEELGGGVAAGRLPVMPSLDGAARAVLVR